MKATSAESNGRNIAAALCKRVKLLTTFVKVSEFSYFNKGELRKRNFEYEGVDVPQGSSWSCRHQINIA